MALHGDINSNTGIHKPAAFEYANETNRLADTRAAGPKDSGGNYRALVDGASGDIGKLAYQADTSKYYTLTAIGTPGGSYGNQGTLTYVAVAAAGAGTGDVSGPGSSVSGNLVSWNNTAGTLVADASKVAADIVTGPASATDGVAVAFDGTTGKLVKSSTLAVADVVTGGGSSVDEQIARYDSTSGKLLQAGTNAPTYSDTGTVDLPAGNITLVASATVDGRDVSVDGGVLDTHVAATANPHATDVANLGTGTKAELVGRLTDATSLLSDVYEDTTPQIGGNLDISAFKIFTTGNNNIALTPGGFGDVILGDATETGTITCERVALGKTVTITSSASMTMDCKAANTFYLTLDEVGASLAITGSSLVSGSTGILWITQGTGGSKTITTWPTEFKFGADGAPTMSTAAAAVDLFTWTTNGTVCLVSVKPGAGA